MYSYAIQNIYSFLFNRNLSDRVTELNNKSILWCTSSSVTATLPGWNAASPIDGRQQLNITTNIDASVYEIVSATIIAPWHVMTVISGINGASINVLCYNLYPASVADMKISAKVGYVKK